MNKNIQNIASLVLKKIISGLIDKKNGRMSLKKRNQHMSKTQ